MILHTERERQALLEQLNNQGRILEGQDPALASELNVKLRQVVEWLVARSQTKPKKGGR